MGSAILDIDFDLIDRFVILENGVARWDGDTYIEPERHFAIKALLDYLCIPASWQIATNRAAGGVWIDYVPDGMIPPHIRAVMQYEFHDWEPTIVTFSHLDMSEVYEYAEKYPATSH
jgi:hypothetical protein